MTVIPMERKRYFDQRKGIAKGISPSEVVAGIAISFAVFSIILA